MSLKPLKKKKYILFTVAFICFLLFLNPGKSHKAKFGYEISDAWNVWADVNLTHFDASNPGEISNPLLDNDQRIMGINILSIGSHVTE